MFTELFSYDPSAIEPEHRERMAGILRARREYLRAAAEVMDYRARTWSGEVGLGEIAEIKAADLAKLRQDFSKQVMELLKASVDLEGLMESLPMLVLAVLRNFKVPLPIVMEAIGLDLDQFKFLTEELKKLVND